MADNVVFQRTPATPPAEFICATDDIGGIGFQRMKLIHGAEGVNAGDVSKTNRLPIEDDYNETINYYDDSGNLEYMCQNTIHGRPLDEETWRIIKITQGVNGMTNREILPGSVEGKEDLAWRA